MTLEERCVFKLLTCLTTQHDLRLVLVASAVCLAGCFTTFRLYSRMRGARGVVRAAWLLLTGLVAGSSVWATHFIAMVAFTPGLKTGYSPTGTLLSLMIAALFMASGFAVASAQRSTTNDFAGGVLIGLGVAAMHYMGMSAFVTQGQLVWEHATVGMSAVLGVGGATAALLLAGTARTIRRQAVGGGMLCLGIVMLHFTGMSAITIVPDASLTVPDQLLSGGMLTLAVGSITSMIILGGLGAVAIESQTSRSALERIRRLANAAYEGLVVVQSGRINDANAAFCDLVGAPLAELVGRPLFGEILTFDEADPSREDVRREGRLRPLVGGREIPVEVFSRLMDDGARVETSGLTVLAVRDLRERRAAEEKIRYLAEHDGLTGLLNRNSLQMRLAAAIDRVEASGESLAVICIDLDHFKEANDQHGHLAGDALLVETARRLQSAVQAPSFAARLGGDEFIVVQIAGGDQPAVAAELAGRLIEMLAAPVPFDGQELAMGSSLGVSLYPDDGRTAEALMANADMALYRAKESGRGVYRFFKREMDDTIRERRNLARDLRQGIADNELIVHYQPLARAADGEVCGFEALVRWKHPTRGMIPPLDFIPVAEENGLIEALGDWVLRRACADAAAWEKPLRIAVNLSPIQLHNPALPTLVHEVLITTGLSPSRLELEITESALFKDYQRALDNLRRLKALGVRIAMDDFGTGFSSLSTLQSFPFDKIKIDKSFVENIHRHDRATAIVRAVLGLGRSLEIPVVAEGVETEEQILFLRGEDCAELQGYAIGRPAPVDALTMWTTAGDPGAIAPKSKTRRSA
ncbi:GGDEF and EAL domain-containing protein [Caulobacter vibrioides]|uniref:bifunctional diguanylate cyclase/phosphodiesterase n=1 Tax=Caulobacter vibrioides TaxID=155892 RepID=UPI000BB4F7D8|nr:EAL domain-containing protein [Caulobacter vibrioides]ATC23108.1 PAS domain-containing protein [Caulobacter vibrioides]AZH11321.1 GGDEF and EAL domain-containing protein [Caulobacter vibrioides]PLR13219.1 PAS domain-containing protein [Caulobacter vibrioides]